VYFRCCIAALVVMSYEMKEVRTKAWTYEFKKMCIRKYTTTT
jgi:hypothetical protein